MSGDNQNRRIWKHPILGDDQRHLQAKISVDGRIIPAITGEPIAAALIAVGIRKFRTTPRFGNPRGLFCAIGRCTDCVMTVDGQPNVRTCVTPVKDGMVVLTQHGLGKWAKRR